MEWLTTEDEDSCMLLKSEVLCYQKKLSLLAPLTRPMPRDQRLDRVSETRKTKFTNSFTNPTGTEVGFQNSQGVYGNSYFSLNRLNYLRKRIACSNLNNRQ